MVLMVFSSEFEGIQKLSKIFFHKNALTPYHSLKQVCPDYAGGAKLCGSSKHEFNLDFFAHLIFSFF
jgi:hypothetical protein